MCDLGCKVKPVTMELKPKALPVAVEKHPTQIKRDTNSALLHRPPF